MFETAELGRRVDKQAFKAAEPQLRTDLLAAQQAAREAGIPVVVIVAGLEGAGKSRVADRLNKWLETRNLRTSAFWDETDEERQRPWFWRFWRKMPAAGEVGLMFWAWYRQPLMDRVHDRIDDNEMNRQLARMVDLERMLAAEGTLVVKLWFHLDRATQQKRLKKREKQRAGERWPIPDVERYAEHYFDREVAAAENLIRRTDTPEAPWTIIESADKRHRDLTMGQTLLAALQKGLEARQPAEPATAALPEAAVPDTEPGLTILDRVDLSVGLEDDEYKPRLKAAQKRLNRLTWAAWNQRRSLVAVFEGWDAGGKGGAIRRATEAMDARLYRVISVAAPTDEERAHHYLWRFWRQLPRDGYATLYDRSWYGRVLVERVEGLASEAQWSRAYAEINDFEEQLAEHGTAVVKFWLHISPEEQLRRFREREITPWKQHKITDEDWRNREKWADYERAVNDMVAHTSTAHAPWVLVPGDDKYYARVMIVERLCEALESVLDEDR
ncbi:MAG TPA: polyphosphate:AMP phosphotransferase [Gammaproteobacteria bacterium]|nr:polyphosphate:AMP phosphotransferase [Gammaproteobacteria bacterium]